MTACAVWMDQELAKVFLITAKGIEKVEIKNHHFNHHTNNQDAHKNVEAERFYHEVSNKIGSTEELIVLGPGPAKNHFKTHLEKHHHAGLLKNLVGLEALDYVSDNQILEKARGLFKKYNTFHTSL